MDDKQPIRVYYSPKGTPYIWASALHSELEISTPLSKWFPRMIEYGFVENQDFSQHDKKVQLAQGGYKVKHEWAIQLDMAKQIAMLQRTEKGRLIRQQLIDLDKKVNTGALLSHTQLSALFDLCQILGYFTIQEYAERKHYDFFNNPKEWWSYRADVFGFSKKDLQEMIEGLGEKYRSQRQVLMKIDKYELINISVVDLLMAMGRTEEYAKNVGKFAKNIAKQIKPHIYDDTDMTIDFKSPDEKEIISKVKDSKSYLLLNEF